MRRLAYGESQRSWLDHMIAWVRIRKIVGCLPKNATILDLGCGYDGEMLAALAPRIKRGVGVDLSVNPQKRNLMVGDVDNALLFPDNTFDVVTALAIIEHVHYPDKMLGEIYRVLKPGGVALFTTPSKYGRVPLEVLAKMGLISQEEIDDHKRYYDKTGLKKEIDKAGFEDQTTSVSYFGIGYLNLFAKAIK